MTHGSSYTNGTMRVCKLKVKEPAQKFIEETFSNIYKIVQITCYKCKLHVLKTIAYFFYQNSEILEGSGTHWGY